MLLPHLLTSRPDPSLAIAGTAWAVLLIILQGVVIGAWCKLCIGHEQIVGASKSAEDLTALLEHAVVAQSTPGHKRRPSSPLKILGSSFISAATRASDCGRSRR